ncbi:hypothetical protein ACFPEU_44295 [Streptomyces mangrovi]
MDYEVFLVSRMREEYSRGKSPVTAMVDGWWSSSAPSSSSTCRSRRAWVWPWRAASCSTRSWSGRCLMSTSRARS